jgi:small subunit ribosomal protein S15
MYLTTERKSEIFKTFGKSEKDTGSTEGQIALFTERINYLTEQLKRNKKDTVTQRSLLKMVGKRRQLLNYLKEKNIEGYRTLIKALNIRK